MKKIKQLAAITGLPLICLLGLFQLMRLDHVLAAPATTNRYPSLAAVSDRLTTKINQPLNITPKILENDEIIASKPVAVVDSAAISGSLATWSIQSFDRSTSPITETFQIETTALAIVNGKPAIAYAYGKTLTYMQAIDSSGTAWNDPIEFKLNEDPSSISLTVINGKPAIGYVISQGSLEGGVFGMYMQSMDANGVSWSLPVTIIDDILSSTPSGHLSLATINDKPAAAFVGRYFDPLLQFHQAENTNGTTWYSDWKYIDTDYDPKDDISLSNINGKPAIVLLDKNLATYVRATDSSGTDWEEPRVISSSAFLHKALSPLVVVDDKPILAVFDIVEEQLQFLQALDADGTSWHPPIKVGDISTDIGETGIIFAEDTPHIIYYDSTNQDLVYVEALDVDGATWRIPMAIDTTGDVGSSLSVATVNGQPAVSYYDATNGQLKFARRTSDMIHNSIVYTPPRDFCGTEQLSYHLEDDISTSNSAVVTIVVECPMSIAISDHYSTIINRTLSVSNLGVLANDTISNSIQISVTLDRAPQNGTLSFSLTEQWRSQTLAKDWGLTRDAQIRIVNGNPAYVYYDQDLQAVKYVRALDQDGAQWADPVYVDIGAISSNSIAPRSTVNTHLAIVNDKPVVAYYIDSYIDKDIIKYAFANDPDGVAWAPPTLMDLPNNIADLINLSFVNGKLAIFYKENRYNELVYAQAQDTTSSSWNTPISINDLTNITPISVALISDKPAVSYYNRTTEAIEYVQANDVNGASWSTPTTVVSSLPYYRTDVYADNSLTEVNGKPAMTYIDSSTYSVNNLPQKLMYIQASDSAGSSWKQPIVVDQFVNNERRPAMTVINDVPAIAYARCDRDQNERCVLLNEYASGYIQALDSDGDNWRSSILVSKEFAHSTPIQYTALATHYFLSEVNHSPVLSYHYYDNDACRLSPDCTDFRPEIIYSKLTPDIGSFQYMPISNFCGTDSFDYYLDNGLLVSNKATVTIDVSCLVYLPALMR